MSMFVSPAPKGAKTDGGNTSSTKTAFMTDLETKRLKAGSSVVQFSFNKRRVRVLTKVDTVLEQARGVVYWMSRDQRVQDNWAMLYSQKLAIKNKIPLHVVFCLMPKFLDATWRHYDFLLKGLRQVEAECSALGIRFHLLLGAAASVLPAFVKEHEMGALVSDFSPLRGARKAVETVTAALPETVPHCQVDAHNVVPCWLASEKLEYAARTIRNKINSKLAEFLTEFPPVVDHPYPPKQRPEPLDWDRAEQSIEVDRKVGPVDWAQPGTAAGLATLDSFCCKRLGLFSTKRNDPTINALSNLSPWLHFGQISAQRAVLCVKARKNGSTGPSVDSFCEELIVRRELADNFCLYNEQYDSVQGTNAWAKESLAAHAGDVREYLYSMPEWEEGRTHDPLWNAAQLQLVKEGKMHGFLRMYWAKKVLEWSESPESALATAIYLNDRFSLDGRDPNGFVGCMWSICGIHDQGWAERPVFGKIRYMNFAGCKRKFDVPAFIARYGGKVHLKKANTKTAPLKKTAAKESPPKKAPAPLTTASTAPKKAEGPAKTAPASITTASTGAPKKAEGPLKVASAAPKKAPSKNETGPPRKRTKKT